MKRILVLLLIVAILCGAFFGVRHFQQKRLLAQWETELDCSPLLSQAYVDSVTDRIYRFGISTEYFNLDKVQRELPGISVPVTLEFRSNGTYTVSVSREALRDAMDEAILLGNAAVAKQVVSSLLDSTDQKIVAALLAAKELVHTLLHVDLDQISDKILVAAFEVSVTDAIDRGKLADELQPQLQYEGRYWLSFGKLRMTLPGHGEEKITVRYRLEDGKLFLEQPKEASGDLAGLFGRSMQRG